jgi:hypothetical protein
MFVSITGVGTGTETLTTAPVLAMPFTNKVARALPGGKLLSDVEVKELLDQLDARSDVV